MLEWKLIVGKFLVIVAKWMQRLVMKIKDGKQAEVMSRILIGWWLTDMSLIFPLQSLQEMIQYIMPFSTTKTPQFFKVYLQTEKERKSENA